MLPPERLTRVNISGDAPWEAVVGYSRAVRVGNAICVSGTTGIGPDGKAVAGGAYAQSLRALHLIGEALDKAGSSFRDVVRTRIYVTNIEDWEDIGRAHSEVFGDVRPATTMVEVCRLISAEIVVEIEADAITLQAGI
ncbi:MAG: RidA family protein [Ktedonobacterales bacterium]